MMSGKQGLWGRNDPMKSGAWREISRPAGLVVGKTIGSAGGNGVEYTAVFDAVNRQVPCTWETGSQTLAGYKHWRGR